MGDPKSMHWSFSGAPIWGSPLNNVTGMSLQSQLPLPQLCELGRSPCSSGAPSDTQSGTTRIGGTRPTGCGVQGNSFHHLS